MWVSHCRLDLDPLFRSFQGPLTSARDTRSHFSSFQGLFIDTPYNLYNGSIGYLSSTLIIRGPWKSFDVHFTFFGVAVLPVAGVSLRGVEGRAGSAGIALRVQEPNCGNWTWERIILRRSWTLLSRGRTLLSRGLDPQIPRVLRDQELFGAFGEFEPISGDALGTSTNSEGFHHVRRTRWVFFEVTSYFNHSEMVRRSSSSLPLFQGTTGVVGVQTADPQSQGQLKGVQKTGELEIVSLMESKVGFFLVFRPFPPLPK